MYGIGSTRINSAGNSSSYLVPPQWVVARDPAWQITGLVIYVRRGWWRATVQAKNVCSPGAQQVVRCRYRYRFGSKQARRHTGTQARRHAGASGGLLV